MGRRGEGVHEECVHGHIGMCKVHMREFQEYINTLVGMIGTSCHDMSTAK